MEKANESMFLSTIAFGYNSLNEFFREAGVKLTSTFAEDEFIKMIIYSPEMKTPCHYARYFNPMLYGFRTLAMQVSIVAFHTE